MISRIALFTCFLLGVTCVTSQQATIQSQLSTNQSLSLWYTCKFPYATATDDQGIAFSSCAQNNGSQGILYTYRDTQGNVQQGWVTSPGNGSCTNSWGLSVSRDGNYVFATCYGNPTNRQIMGYEKQMNGSTWYWNYMSLNTSNWACGKDIIYDTMTENIYAICGPALGSVDTRIIKFPHNATSDSYMNPQDLGIMANYIKYNPFNQYLYYATTSNLGYFSMNSDNGTSIPLSTNTTMPTNITVIPINGTLSNWCEITSFTFSHNSSNTLYVGCTGFHNIATSYTSYSILRIDANQTWISVNVTIPVVVTNTTDNSTSLINITTTQNISTWNYQVVNISYTDSKLSGTDGNNDLTYPADGSCKGPSDMEMDSMNQLYVACTQNPSTRSVIRYTPINSTSYLPAYVTSAVVGCSHPLTNSLSLNLRDDVLISCSADNKGLLFTTIQNSTLIPTNPPNNNSSSSTGGSGPTGNPTGNPSGSTGNPTSNPTGTGSSVICPGGVCVPTNTSSSTGTIGNTASHTRVNIAGVAFALVLLVVSM